MKDDGGPAFPREGGSALYDPPHRGMTMRQFYKGEYLSGLDSSDRQLIMAEANGNWDTAAIMVAQIAAKFADAQIAEDRAFAEKDDG